jgi:hypothetical protein
VRPGQTVVNSGPSDAQVAASTQLAMAQMSAGLQGQAIQLDYAKSQNSNDTQLALATIGAALQQQQTAAETAIAAQTVAAQVHGLDLQYQTAVASNAAQIQAMKDQYNYGLASLAVNANLQEVLSANQLKAFGYSSAVSAIGSAKAGDRDQLTAQYMAMLSGSGVSYGNVGGKGGVYVAPSGNTNPPVNTVTIASSYQLADQTQAGQLT